MGLVHKLSFHVNSLLLGHTDTVSIKWQQITVRQWKQNSEP